MPRLLSRTAPRAALLLRGTRLGAVLLLLRAALLAALLLGASAARAQQPAASTLHAPAPAIEAPAPAATAAVGALDDPSIFAARSTSAGLPPLPSRGCRLPLDQRTQGEKQGQAVRHLSSGGHTRRFLLSMPSGEHLPPMPLVLNLHGLTEPPEMQILFSRMEPAALARGWAVAWPEGVGYSWNAGRCCGRARAEEFDDVQFVRDLVAQLGREMCLDLRRVYATGMSNGGFMSYRLACDASDLLAAVAPVAAVDGTLDCHPAHPIALLAFNGTSDLLVPIGGRPWDGFPSAQQSFERWQERDRCAGKPRVVYEKGRARCEAASGCAGSADVVSCALDGGGHTWPGGMHVPILGRTVDDVDGSVAILDFFAAHARN